MPFQKHSAAKEEAASIGAASARNRALSWLARREHSSHQIRQKLARIGCPEAVAESLIRQLGEEGLLSDERYAEMLSRTRFNRGFGPVRVRAELRSQGVDDETIAQYANLDEHTLLQQARTALEKRFGGLRAQDQKSRAQQARFLAYKGFPSDLIFRAISGEGDPD